MTLQSFTIVLISIAVTFFIIIPNIYIKNKIYYVSRDVGKLYEQYIILQEESRELQRKIEAIQFKNQVLDDLALEEDMKEEED
ncbi:MAG: hypothetical protein KGV58_01255 [Campylobacteraceae bacterium]|nr:hypothetical protein [Campylobacteraceae bacterium]